MTLRIYNSLGKATKPFSPHDPKEVNMYVCGMTVYDHARSMVDGVWIYGHVGAQYHRH